MNDQKIIDTRLSIVRQAADQVATCDDVEARRALMNVIMTWTRWASDTSVSTDWTGPLDHMVDAFDPDARTPVDPSRPNGSQFFIAEQMWAHARKLIALDVLKVKTFVQDNGPAFTVVGGVKFDIGDFDRSDV